MKYSLQENRKRNVLTGQLKQVKRQKEEEEGRKRAAGKERHNKP
jgi:hypothetical protein